MYCFLWFTQVKKDQLVNKASETAQNVKDKASQAADSSRDCAQQNKDQTAGFLQQVVFLLIVN